MGEHRLDEGEHRVTLGVGYQTGFGEGVVAECSCGWVRLFPDGVGLDELVRVVGRVVA
jgi:hypothetical protein